MKTERGLQDDEIKQLVETLEAKMLGLTEIHAALYAASEALRALPRRPQLRIIRGGKA
mgnify:CR=1 FL=1